MNTIESLNLPISIYVILKRAGINDINQLKSLSDEKLLKIRGISYKRVDEIKRRLADFNDDDGVYLIHSYYPDSDKEFKAIVGIKKILIEAESKVDELNKDNQSKDGSQYKWEFVKYLKD